MSGCWLLHDNAKQEMYIRFSHIRQCAHTHTYTRLLSLRWILSHILSRVLSVKNFCWAAALPLGKCSTKQPRNWITWTTTTTTMTTTIRKMKRVTLHACIRCSRASRSLANTCSMDATAATAAAVSATHTPTVISIWAKWRGRNRNMPWGSFLSQFVCDDERNCMQYYEICCCGCGCGGDDDYDCYCCCVD